MLIISLDYGPAHPGGAVSIGSERSSDPGRLDGRPDSGERRAIIEMARDFAAREIAPRVAEYDQAEELPADLLDKMAALGLFGGVIPVEVGGMGLDFAPFVALIEEISKNCQILGTLASMPSGLVGASIERFGSDE